MKIIQGFHISVQGHRQNNYNNRNKYIGECVTAKLCVFINEDFLKAAKPPVPLLFNIKKKWSKPTLVPAHIIYTDC